MTSAALLDHADDGVVGEDDPAAKPRRRRFTAEYKLAILAEYERLTDPGAKGALLRREGLYSSHLVEWRRARDAGAVRELAAKPRPAKRTPEQVEIERLRRRNERLEADLVKHRLALQIQGKASELLERLLAESDETGRQQP
jgi:transposase-like protein